MESAGTQVDLVTGAIHMNTLGPFPVKRGPIPQELLPQISFRAEEVEVGMEITRIPEGGGDGIKRVVPQPCAVACLGTSEARPPFGPFAGDGVDSDQRIVVAVDQENVREEPIAVAIQQDYPLLRDPIKLAIGVGVTVQLKELRIGPSDLYDSVRHKVASGVIESHVNWVPAVIQVSEGCVRDDKKG